jgi:hypothetical protein
MDICKVELFRYLSDTYVGINSMIISILPYNVNYYLTSNTNLSHLLGSLETEMWLNKYG